VVSYSLLALLALSSLLLFAAVRGRDAAARCNGVPLVYSYSTTLVFLQGSKIWVCTLYLFLIIHTARQSILFLLTSGSASTPWTSGLHPVT
jgi:hypothetical protein